jgi:cell division protein FtsB
MAERRFAVEADIENLNKREEVLNKEVNYLSDERGVEAEMRRQFDIVREGEQAVIILGEKEDANEKSTTTTSTTTKRAWYKFW